MYKQVIISLQKVDKDIFPKVQIPLDLISVRRTQFYNIRRKRSKRNDRKRNTSVKTSTVTLLGKIIALRPYPHRSRVYF